MEPMKTPALIRLAELERKRKRNKLQELMGKMHPQGRQRFLHSQRKHKPNLDHDLFVASLHVPVS